MQVVKHLLSSYNIVNSIDNDGNTALNMAAYRGCLPVVEVLISASPATTALRNKHGDTFLHMAVAGFRSPGFRRLDRQIELMKQIVSGKTVDLRDIINVRNNDGRTALHMAVMENIQSELVELLMSVPSINLNVRDHDGNTPLDLLKQRPQSASSEILIKQLISAGGISDCQDLITRKMQQGGIRGSSCSSPGTSFRIPDAEIFLYTGIENASDSDIASTEYEYDDDHYHTFSGEITSSYYDSAKKLGSMNSAAKHLKMFLLPRKKDHPNNNRNNGETDSVNSFKMEGGSPVSLRQRFSQMTSLSTNKRIVAEPNNLNLYQNLPSPSSKKKFAAGLMQGVIQVKKQSSLGLLKTSFSGPLSESSSSWSSPVSADHGELSNGGGSSTVNRKKPAKMHRKSGSFNMKKMNQYLCFGAQGIATDNHHQPINFRRQSELSRQSSLY